MNKIDLNDSYIEMDDRLFLAKDFKIDNSTYVENVSVKVLFKNQKRELLKLIRSHNYVVGCVAWLTDFDILDALSKVEHVSIIVQKEDFLRPETDNQYNNRNSFTAKLQLKYKAITTLMSRYQLPGIISGLSVSSDDSFDSIRCAGINNKSKAPASPRMHNKFLIFGNTKVIKTTEYSYDELSYDLSKVWTGSYNLSYNATKSLENAVVLTNEDIAKAYHDEYSNTFAISEPLDWTSDWIEPEYRIGT